MQVAKFHYMLLIHPSPLLLSGFPPVELLGGIPPSQRQGELGQEMLRKEADMTSISAVTQPGEILWWGLKYPWFA